MLFVVQKISCLDSRTFGCLSRFLLLLSIHYKEFDWHSHLQEIMISFTFSEDGGGTGFTKGHNIQAYPFDFG
jgi:hypothetical protein